MKCACCFRGDQAHGVRLKLPAAQLLRHRAVHASAMVDEAMLGELGANQAGEARAPRDLYRELVLNKAVTDRAQAVQRQLVKRGRHRGPSVPDLLIAATAEVHGAIVVHYDRDFELIAAHTRQLARWIVPAGRVS